MLLVELCSGASTCVSDSGGAVGGGGSADSGTGASDVCIGSSAGVCIGSVLLIAVREGSEAHTCLEMEKENSKYNS